MSGPVRPPLTVSDVDDGGSTTGRPINRIEVTDGTLTITGTTAKISTGGGGSGTVTSVGLTETGSALTITGSPVTTSGTINIAGAGTSSQVILGDLSLGTLTSGTVTGTGTANQVAYWSGSSAITGDADLTFDGTNLTVGGYIKSGTGVFDTVGTRDLTLQTNGGTSSGTIIIRDGAGQDIEISPEGSGVINLDGLKWPTADGSANQVLQTDGAGTLSFATSGGGNDFNVELCGTELDASGTGYAVFDVMAMPPYGVARFTTGTINTSSKQYFFPFIAPFSANLGTMYYNITSAAGAATNLYIAIYEDNNGVPSDVIGYATVDATSTGAQTISSFSSTIALTRGTQYYISMTKDNGTQSIGMRSIDNSYIPRIAPSNAFPSTTNGYSTNFATNSAVVGTPANITAEQIEPGVYFSGLGFRPHIGLKE